MQVKKIITYYYLIKLEMSVIKNYAHLKILEGKYIDLRTNLKMCMIL